MSEIDYSPHETPAAVLAEVQHLIESREAVEQGEHVLLYRALTGKQNKEGKFSGVSEQQSAAFGFLFDNQSPMQRHVSWRHRKVSAIGREADFAKHVVGLPVFLNLHEAMWWPLRIRNMSRHPS